MIWEHHDGHSFLRHNSHTLAEVWEDAPREWKAHIAESGLHKRKTQAAAMECCEETLMSYYRSRITALQDIRSKCKKGGGE